MEKKSDTVQIVVLVVFGIGIILGVLFFSGKITLPWDKESEKGISGVVNVWGLLPYGNVKGLFDSIEMENKNLTLIYTEKKPEMMQTELVNALSSGKGPDVFMMSPGEVAQNIDRLYIVPYSVYPEPVYRTTFIDAGTDFLTKQGILAFPMYVNPLVMYYNFDMLNSAYIVNPPTTWDELAGMVPTLTIKDDAGKITQSAVALGTASNASYVKDLIVLKTLQSGNPIIQATDNSLWQAVVGEDGLGVALEWFTSFNSSSSPNYTWNQSLPKDRDFFNAGKLGIFFGYPADYETMREKNPNLNFRMAAIPQISATSKKVNYGQLYSFGISKISKNLAGSVGIVNVLTSKENMATLLTELPYAPTRRDLLSDKPRDDSNKVLIFNSAIISKSFLDPDAKETNKLIINAVNQINAGTKSVGSAFQAVASGFRDLASKLVLPELPLQ